MFRQIREEVNVYQGNLGNSDRARDSGQGSYYCKGRYGFGLAPCEGTIENT